MTSEYHDGGNRQTPEPGFLTGYGKSDTHAITVKDATTGERKPNPSRNAGKPYSTVTWQRIRQLVESPTATDKNKAQFVILSTYTEHDGRTHSVQREHGAFYGLAIDIDKGNHDIDTVVAAVDAVTGGAAAEVYSSSSATADDRKWRTLVPSAVPIPGADYADTQRALFALLAERGIQCDTTLDRAGQPIYLPNVPKKKRDADGTPLFYDFRHVEGTTLNLTADHPIVMKREAARRQRAADEAAAEKRRAEYQTRRLEYVRATGDDFDAIEHFKATHSVAATLAHYGFTQSPDGSPNWKSPDSGETTGYTTEVLGDKWRAISGWAERGGVGRPSKSGNSWIGDAFDLFVAYTHGGNFRAAIDAYTKEVRPKSEKKSVDNINTSEPPSEPIPEWQPFPVHRLPSPLREFVEESVASMSADPVAFVLPLLSATAAAIGTSRRIELWNGWTEPAVLWTAMVAESGSMKSPPFKSATSQTMARHKDTLTEHAAAMRHWEQEKREYDRASRRQNGGDIGEPPEKPVAERVLVDDLTIESLAPILAGNPVGVLLAKEELSGWFDFDRYTGGKGGGEAARWLSCYDASSLTVDRKGGGTIFVPAAAVSIAGTIQPRTLVRVVGSKHLDNGLLQRFMLAMPPKKKKSIPKGGLSFTTTESMRQLFDTLFAIRPAEDGTPKVIDFDAEANALWEKFYDEHSDAQHEASGVVASMLAKAEAWAARLTLVFHMVNQAHAGAGDRVTADTLAAGIAVARWAAHEWQRVLRIMESGAIEADDAGLVSIIQKHGGAISVRDLARVGPAAYRVPGAAEAAARRLVKRGKAAWQAEATGGRPADAIRLV